MTLAIADGAVLAEAKTKLIVASRAASARLASTPEDQDRAQQFHAQGMEQIKIGNIAAARRFFELAAEAGLANSVMELAGTYDPNELGKFGAFGPGLTSRPPSACIGRPSSSARPTRRSACAALQPDERLNAAGARTN